MGFHNETRGLRIEGTDFSYMTEGAVGLVFVNQARSRIRKLFRFPDHHNVEHSHQVFAAEVEAYDIASRSETLRPLVPTFFGTIPPQQVMDSGGRDVSGECLYGLGFEVQFIPGHFDKLSRVLKPVELEALALLFRDEGIMDMQDASGCLLPDGSIKVVDFSTKVISLCW